MADRIVAEAREKGTQGEASAASPLQADYTGQFQKQACIPGAETTGLVTVSESRSATPVPRPRATQTTRNPAKVPATVQSTFDEWAGDLFGQPPGHRQDCRVASEGITSMLAVALDPSPH